MAPTDRYPYSLPSATSPRSGRVRPSPTRPPARRDRRRPWGCLWTFLTLFLGVPTLLVALLVGAVAFGFIGPPEVTQESNGYIRFDGHVAQWDACKPVDWVLRAGPGPANAAELASEALARVTEATGLEFRYAGTINQPVWRGDEEALSRTVYIMWMTPAELSQLESAGMATMSIRRSRGSDGYEMRTGFVALDAERALEPNFEPGRSTGAVLLHELGHVMGLAHSSDPSSSMYTGQLPAAYGRRDLELLAGAVEEESCT